jgi:flagellar hook-basal body complex protein FliE
MSINFLNSLNSFSASMPLAATDKNSFNSTLGFDDGKNFGTVIKNAVESINDSQKSAEHEISKAVTGETQDLHKTIIALQTADLKFQLGLQVRNKLIGAYEEVMRMQV